MYADILNSIKSAITLTGQRLDDFHISKVHDIHKIFTFHFTTDIVSRLSHLLTLASRNNLNWLEGIEIWVTGGNFVGGLSEEGDEDVESKGHSKRWRQGALRGRELWEAGNFERHMRFDPFDIVSGKGQHGLASWGENRFSVTSLRQILNWSSPVRCCALQIFPSRTVPWVWTGQDVQVCRSAGFLGSISTLKAGKTENFPCSVSWASSTFDMVRVLLGVIHFNLAITGDSLFNVVNTSKGSLRSPLDLSSELG